MSVEKKWLTVLATPFTANGTQFGVVTVADTAGFKVKGFAYIVANTLPPLEVQIQRVISPTQMIVGPPRTIPSPSNFIDISAYTTVLSAQIGFGEQNKNHIKPDDVIAATYEGDPTVAWRTVLVDQYGDFYTGENPLPISFDGTISIGEVEVIGKNGNTIEPNTDGSLNVNIVSTPSSSQIVVNTYNEVTLVPSGSPTQIVSYTVPPSTESVLQKCVVSGENIARYDLILNGVTIDTLRTYFGGGLNAEFDFTTGSSAGLVLNAGDILKIQVLQNRLSAVSFEGRIQVLQINL